MVAPNSFKNDLPALPNEWSWQPIGECFDFKNGLNKAKHFFGYGKPIINYMDVFAFSGIYASQIKGKVDVDANEMRSFEVKKGDVLFTRTSETVDEVGISCAVLDEVTDTVFSGFVLRGRPKNNKLNDLFKKYVFSSASVRKQITSKATYTTRALTNGRVLSDILIPVPDCEKEQQAIAEALSDADALIASLEKLIEKKAAVKNGIFERIFSANCSEQMVWRKLGEIAKINMGQSPTSDFYNNKSKGLPLIQGNADIINRKTIRRTYTTSYPKVADKGDLILTVRAPVGDVAQASEKICLGRGVCGIKTNFNTLKFFFENMEGHWAEHSSGSTFDSVNQVQLSQLEVSVPRTKEIDIELSKMLEDQTSEILFVEAQLQKAKKVKAGMMQELLTGRTRLI